VADNLSADLASLRIDRAPRPPSSTPWWGCALVALALAAAAGYLGYRHYAPSVFKTEVSTTEVLLLSPAQASTELTGVGYVVAQRQSKVACQLLSRIAEMKVHEGQKVKAGDELFHVEDAAQRAALSAAKARASGARARLNAATAALAELRQQLAREKNLAEQEAGTIAAADDRREQVRAQEATLKAAEHEVAAADEDVHAAEVQLDYTKVRAPFDGIVLGKPLTEGELVGTVTEQPAVELADPAPLLAEIDVPERRIEKVKNGGPAEVILDSYPDSRYRATVVEVGSRVDRSKGTVIVKLKLLEVPDRLLPDMRARANFLTEALDAKAAKEPPKNVVPRAAVAERGGAKVVFKIEDGRVRMMPVTVGGEFGGGLELKSGPPPGTVLVADPPATMADGQPVKEKNK
jgi:HlyD family secretion protein